MSKLSATTFLLFLFVTNSYCQSSTIVKIAKDCSTEELRKNLYYLASPELEGRMLATKGDTLASQFIAEHFRKSNLVAPYNGTYFQAVKAQKILNSFAFELKGKTYGRFEGWSVYPPRVNVNLHDVSVSFNQFTTPESLEAFIEKTDLKGTMITLSLAITQKLFQDDESIEKFERKCRDKGIVGLVWFGPRADRNIKMIKTFVHEPEYENKELDSLESPATSSGTSVFPELALDNKLINELLSGDNLHINVDGSFAEKIAAPIILKNKVSVVVEKRIEEVIAPNVIGVLPGRDTSLPAIVVSAHHDHEGVQNGELFPGAVDNASGTVAIMQIAAMMNKAVSQGQRPKRSVIFASFTGEEKGLIGSFYYVKNPLKPINETYVVMNFDMMGRVDTFYSGKRKDSSYAYVIVMDSTHGFRKQLYSANEALPKLKLDTYYEQPENLRRRLYGSDQLPFYLKGVPFIRIDCGFAKEYHQQTDTPDKINYPLLTKQTQLAFLALWNIANN